MELALVGRLLGACVVIALVLGGLQIVASRLGRSRFERGLSGRLVSLVETTYLPGAATVHVVRVAERYLVVGRNAATISTLCELSSADVDRWLEAHPVAAPNPVEPVLRFASRLRGRKA